MYSPYRIWVRFCSRRRIVHLLLFVWLTSTFSVFFMKNTHSNLPRSHRVERLQGNETVIISDDQETHVTVSLKKSESKTNGNVDSLTYFISKAKSDPKFLNWLLDQPFLHKLSPEILKSFLTDIPYNGFDKQLKSSDEINLQRNYNISSDVMVFLHIQKTGGTKLNDRFLKELQLPFKCACTKKLPCSCRSSTGTEWIYTSVYSGWACGLHADWTQLHRCIPERIDKIEGKPRQRRYFYFTQLRDPLQRYISEWRHQRNQNHWQDAILGCGDGFSDWADIRPCFHSANWKGVTLDDFIGCPHNLATNRQARMLADLTLTNCYRNYASRSAMFKRAVGWVDSAIENLMNMEYFGLMEEGAISDKLFSKTYGLKFSKSNIMKQSGTNSAKITKEQFKKILGLVELDIYVYMFAKQLLKRRQELKSD